MKKVGLVAAITLILVVLMNACGSQASNEDMGEIQGNDQGGDGENITLVAAHVEPIEGAYQAGMEKFKEVVEQESNGSIEIEIHPNGALGGSDSELVQKMNTGTLDIVPVAPGFLSEVVNEVGLLSTPYLFESREHWAEVLNGEVGDEMTELIENNSDFKVLGFWIRGVRSYFGTEPIVSPEDLQGVRIRVQNSHSITRTWEAYGAQPASVAFNELYQALQTGVLDAAENDFTNIYQMKFHEVAPYISLTEHEFLTPAFLMSQKKFDQLTEEQQQVIEKAAIAATEAEREIDRELNEVSLQQLEESGAIVNEVDKEAFVELTKPIQLEVAESLGLEELMNKIINN